MARKFLTPIDLTQSELQNAVFQHLPSAPLAPVDGLFYLNSTATRLYFWNASASAWQLKATDSDLLQGQNGAYYLSLANATGTLATAQLADGSVSLAKQAQLAANSIQGNNTGGAATPMALTVAQAKILLALAVTDVAGAEATANKGNANGYAGLDATGKVPTGQLPASVLGALNFQSTWNASTNSPALASGAGTKGWFYVCSVAGTTSLDGLAAWNVGDWAVFNGTTWNKVDGVASEVVSVAGRTGAIVLTTADISGLSNYVQKYAVAFGDGSSTSYTITHGLGTQDVTVGVYAAASPFAEIECDVNHATVNTLTLTFANAPTAGQYRVVVHG